MAELRLKAGMFIWGFSLVLLCSAAQRDYFVHNSGNMTWDEARNHCQVCFKELATVTPENIETIAQNVSSDSWVGLRRNASDGNSVSWSRWADGERLLFQNWYPGWPILRKDTCHCSGPTTTTATSFTPFTSPNMTTAAGFPNATYTTVRLFGGPAVPRGAERVPNYVEDSCVAMLSFGAWVERSCSERLSFVCYEDRFPGRVDVTELTSGSATLTWLHVPNIDHYWVEVKGHEGLKVNQSVTDRLSLGLANLTAGSRHSVQVFPVKCDRYKHPQQTAFYTKPNKVENLLAGQVTETSVALNWSKPAGNVDFYRVEVDGVERNRSETEVITVGDLTPGTLYTFTVLSVVNHSIWSDESNIPKYTKPEKVSSLEVSAINNTSLVLKWSKPDGQTTGYRVEAATSSDPRAFNKTVRQTDVMVTPLPSGTRVNLTVTALTDGDALEGDPVTVVISTAPEPVTNLVLTTTHNTLNASWISTGGDSLSFTVELRLDGELLNMICNVSTPMKHFDRLKAAAKYTVTVYAVAGQQKSPPVEASNFTSLVPPTDARLRSRDENQLTFEWSAPENIAKVNYTVRLNSTFWGHDFSAATNKTFYTFNGLKSGTKYDFRVRIDANGQQSDPDDASSDTVAVEKEITLSMMCSSATPLLCGQAGTRKSVFEELKAHFGKLLGDSVVWELKEHET